MHAWHGMAWYDGVPCSLLVFCMCARACKAPCFPCCMACIKSRMACVASGYQLLSAWSTLHICCVACRPHPCHLKRCGISGSALLDSDGSGVLKDLPDDCGVCYMGKHVLSGAGEPLDLLLVLPEPLRCRLALQQADLRSQAVKVPGILTAPVPSPAASDSTALAFVQFSGLSTLMAWDAEETSKAIRLASACISDVLASCQGTLSEDGLQLSVLQRNPSRMSAYPDAVQPGRAVCAFAAGASADADSQRPVAVSFALALRTRLLMEDWGERLLSHALAEPVGTVEAADAAFSTGHGDFWLPSSPQHDVPQQRMGAPSPSGKLLTTVKERSERDVSSQQEDSVSLGETDSSYTPFRTSQAEARTPLALQTPREYSGRAVSFMSPPSRASGSVASPAVKSKHSMPLLQKRESKWTSLDAEGLRGLRCKIVVVLADQATFSVAKRSTGRVVYEGPSVKRALKALANAHAGQIIIHKGLE